MVYVVLHQILRCLVCKGLSISNAGDVKQSYGLHTQSKKKLKITVSKISILK